MKRLLWFVALLLAIGAGCRSPETPPALPPATSSPAANPTASATSPPTVTYTPTVSPPSPIPTPAVNSAQTVDCNNPQTQEVIDRCAAEQAYNAADAKLNQVYQQLRASLTSSEQAQLTEVETAWLEFRDRNCDFESSQVTGEIRQSTVRYRCLEALTQDRTAELQAQAEPL
jgi:uncharacterized protein YecT (DUF1311 family)